MLLLLLLHGGKTKKNSYFASLSTIQPPATCLLFRSTWSSALLLNVALAKGASKLFIEIFPTNFHQFTARLPEPFEWKTFPTPHRHTLFTSIQSRTAQSKRSNPSKIPSLFLPNNRGKALLQTVLQTRLTATRRDVENCPRKSAGQQYCNTHKLGVGKLSPLGRKSCSLALRSGKISPSHKYNRNQIRRKISEQMSEKRADILCLMFYSVAPCCFSVVVLLLSLSQHR